MPRLSLADQADIESAGLLRLKDNIDDAVSAFYARRLIDQDNVVQFDADDLAATLDRLLATPSAGSKVTSLTGETTTDLALVSNNITFVKHAAHTLGIIATTTTNTAGGALTVRSANGNGNAAGGLTIVEGGSGGATGAGGGITLRSGIGGTTSGASGAVSIVSGLTTADSASATGASTFGSGAGCTGTTTTNGGASGAVTITTGVGGAKTGTGTANGGAAGTLAFTGGAGGATASTNGGSVGGAGSTINVTAGAGGAASAGTANGGAGGSIILGGGAGGTSAGGTAGKTGAIIHRSPVLRKSVAGVMTDTATIAVADILTGLIKATPTAAASYTMPTGTVLEAALPADIATGDSIEFTFVNVATNDSFDITLVTAASGITLFGNLVVEANSATTKVSCGTFRAVRTGSATYDVYRVR